MTIATLPSHVVRPRTVRAPRGPEISCRGWEQEAAMRMLMNNLDPEVAERPDELVVYGGRGKAARSWQAFEDIVATLKTLSGDETLLLQSGKPVAVFRTTENAPLVLLANAVDVHEALLARGVTPDVVTDQTSAHDLVNGYVPAGLSLPEADALRHEDTHSYEQMARASTVRQVTAMLAFKHRGAVVFD